MLVPMAADFSEREGRFILALRTDPDAILSELGARP